MKLAKDNPVKFLIKSEGEFFRDDDILMGLKEQMSVCVKNVDFIGHMRDAVGYRNKKYYEERKY